MSARFSFTDEQEEFRASVRRFLRDRSPPAAVRAAMVSERGYDCAVWRALCADLGVAGLHVPEACGGAGFGFVELGIVMEEFGRALVCAPYFASAVLATQAIRNAAPPAEQAELLAPIARGEVVATLAWAESTRCRAADDIALTAAPRAGGYVLDGRKRYVVDGHSADLVVVAARAPATRGEHGLALFVVDGAGAGAGLQRRRLESLDPTRPLAELVFTAVPARLLGEAGAGWAALSATLDQAAVALACETVGAAQTLLDMAVAYAGERMQFGRPIGSFQAIKHKCADLLLDIELARAATGYAAAALAEGDPEAAALAALAQACAADACVQAAAECIQIHGGIGFTWDHDAHLWFRRAHSSAVLLGDSDWHRERYLTLLEPSA